MGRLTRAAAALAVAAAPLLGAVAAAHPGGALADNGVLHGNSVVGPGSVRTLAEDGVIHAQLAGASGAVVAPADNGVIHGNTAGAPEGVRILADDGVIHAQLAGASGAVVVPADDGVISSRS